MSVIDAKLRAALVIVRERLSDQVEDSHYGSPASPDPRDFTPDPECSTEAERAAHRMACDAWDEGGCPPIPRAHEWGVLEPGGKLPEGTVSALIDADGNYRVHRQPYGLGTTTFRDEPLAEALAVIDAALEAT